MTKRAARARNRRTETVAFRVSPEDRQRLEDGAIEAGMTLSAYLAALLDRRSTSLRARLAAMQEPKPPPQPEHRTLSPEVMNQLSRIGNNLNQIAHAVNSGLPADTRHVIVQLQRFLDLILANNLQPPATGHDTKTAANDDPTSSSTRQEFQRSVHLRNARSWEFIDR